MSGPWASEDAGPERRQAARGRAPSGRLAVVSRAAPGAHMVVLGDGGFVFAYGGAFGAPSAAWVERLDAATLQPLARRDGLPGGPWWPGGMALHPNGSLHVVHGRRAHRLSPDLDLLASRELPQDRPYNSFVTLGGGALVTKDLVRDGSAPSRLVVLDPERLEMLGPEIAAPEPSIARLSADQHHVYVIGDHTAFRYRIDGARLLRDDWSFRYRTRDDQSYGWDPVIAGGHVWFMDNGAHDYAGTMRGRGIATGPVCLVRVAIDDPGDHELMEVSGLPTGAITNPPLYDERSRIAVAYDSANGVLAAFRFEERLVPLWRRDCDTAGHLVSFPDDGTLMAYDHHDGVEDVVFLELATGVERTRGSTGSPVQSVVFPAAADGVVYYTSFTTLARIASET